MHAKLLMLWQDYLRPMFLRPRRLQVAALCYRLSAGKKEVLMITSRDSGRWIIPKGWPMAGKTCAEAALQEAWEEAGVSDAQIEADPVGSYNYYKRRDNGTEEPVTTLIYAAEVHQLADHYPEVGQRKRQWVSPSMASTLVDEPELRDLLRDL